MYPVIIPVPITPANLPSQIERLERSLILTLETLQMIIDRLESKFGEDVFANQTKSASMLRSEQEAEETVKKLDDLEKQGQKSAVVRELRSEFGLTWDQAHAAYNEWNTISRSMKVRRLRLSRWLAKTGAITPTASAQSYCSLRNGVAR